MLHSIKLGRNQGWDQPAASASLRLHISFVNSLFAPGVTRIIFLPPLYVAGYQPPDSLSPIPRPPTPLALFRSPPPLSPTFSRWFTHARTHPARVSVRPSIPFSRRIDIRNSSFVCSAIEGDQHEGSCRCISLREMIQPCPLCGEKGKIERDGLKVMPHCAGINEIAASSVPHFNGS